jgi:(3R)-3-hydroxyacyl-CoA dehydrogenase / 3a,7a,12a-trihydroxy-5b-cholest-24-enoyl-CoA hydratase / enoyl-CoA hydratase 2
MSAGQHTSNVTAAGRNEWIDVGLALGFELPTITSSYSTNDVALYALGVGAAATADESRELRYVYEHHADGFTTLPTYAVVPALNYVYELAKRGISAPGLSYGLERILHGEQSLELVRPFPVAASLEHSGCIKAIYDKGKNAVVVMEVLTRSADGELLARNEVSLVIRGAGGFGGERGPQHDSGGIPDRTADAVSAFKTAENQALLYRLSGDANPLHADPDFARAFGFERPILHGLCTLGIAVRQIVGRLCDNAPQRVKGVRARFSGSVYPGETLVTEMWKADHRILFQSKVRERDLVVVSSATVHLHT